MTWFDVEEAGVALSLRAVIVRVMQRTRKSMQISVDRLAATDLFTANRASDRIF